MPIKNCTFENKPGFKWGDQGKCFTYNTNDPESRNRAREKALEQGRVIEVQKTKDL
jgi:hypothetical protein